MKKETIFEGRILTLAVEDAVLPNGRQHRHEVVHHPGGAAAVPIFENGEVLLIRQYRHVTGGWIWEIPAGKLDVEGEDPLACAKRELEEETGCRAARWEQVAQFYPSPGFCDEVLTVFRATHLSETALAREEHEVMELHRMTPERVQQLLAKGELRDSKTLIGLYACGVLST